MPTKMPMMMFRVRRPRSQESLCFFFLCFDLPDELWPDELCLDVWLSDELWPDEPCLDVWPSDELWLDE